MRLNAGGLGSLVIGRQKEITTLKTYINLGQHTVITAPRRYGKTTLAMRVLKELKADYLIARVDIFEATDINELCDIYLNAVYKSVGIADFLRSAAESVFSLLDRFSLSYENEGIKIGYEISKTADINQKIEKTFNFPEKFATLFSKKMVVFIDEFGDAQKFGDDFIKKLRSYMQTHKNVVYVFAGSQPSVINDIFLNRQNAFFNFASLMNIALLDKESVFEFLDTLEIDGKTLRLDAAKKLYESTRFHPFYLIKTLIEGYIQAIFDESDSIDTAHIDKAIAKILDDNNAYFEAIWSQINRKKYKGAIFRSFCGGKQALLDVGASYKSQLIKELKSDGLLSDELTPTDPFLCLWLEK